ncbi:MAG TPA: hypothetical protein VGF16_16635 [Bryobacteraceae bacterium]|jgi:hypothetical protein
MHKLLLLVTAMVALNLAALAKADVAVASSQTACVIGVRGAAHDVIRVACTAAPNLNFVRECKAPVGTDGCFAQFEDVAFRLFRTIHGQPVAIVNIAGTIQRFNL